MKKRFSLKNKLIFIFGTLITIAAGIEGIFAVRIARKAVTEKIEAHLIDKATDTATIIDGRVKALLVCRYSATTIFHIKRKRHI